MNGSRLFPDCESNQISKKTNDKLIAKMSQNSNNGAQLSNIFAGFTYLGQMIAHEIVESTNNSKGRKISKASMMLESIYGDKSFNEQYEIFDDYHKFIFSEPSGCSDIRCKNYDLYRANGNVIIPEQRNDENFLVSQLHLFWQKLHNKIINNLKIDDYCCISLYKKNAQDKFKFAKEMVIKLFQQVVVEDYLYNILDIEIYSTYSEVLNSGSKDLFFYFEKDVMDKVPLEFSHAVFRFGHSMVRDKYRLSKGDSVSLQNLFNQSHDSINVNFIVNWYDFFGVGNLDESTIKSFRIDDVITNPMQKIPLKNPIIRLNLEAGFDSKLPSGFQLLYHIQKNYKYIAHKLKLDCKEYQKTHDDIKNQMIHSYELKNFKDTPLWLYILLEANLTNSNRLGKLGSAIVAEVIIKSILQADISILKNRKTLCEDKIAKRADINIFKYPMNNEQVFQTIVNDHRRFTMLDLLNFVNKI